MMWKCLAHHRAGRLQGGNEEGIERGREEKRKEERKRRDGAHWPASAFRMNSMTQDKASDKGQILMISGFVSLLLFCANKCLFPLFYYFVLISTGFLLFCGWQQQELRRKWLIARALFYLSQGPLAGQARGLELVNFLWTREKRKEGKLFIQTKHTHTYIHKHTMVCSNHLSH